VSNQHFQARHVDPDTGEVYKEEGHKGFIKLFLGSLDNLQKMKGGRKHIQVFCYMLKNYNKRNNRLSRTQVQIAEDLDICRSYVSKILTHFEDINICVNGWGWYLLNPEMVWFGKREPKRRKILNFYIKYRRDKKHG